MPFDSFPKRVPSDGGHRLHQCPSCKQPIAPYQAVEQIQLPHDPLHGADKINGTYHAECAKPFMSLIGALNMLKRWG